MPDHLLPITEGGSTAGGAFFVPVCCFPFCAWNEARLPYKSDGALKPMVPIDCVFVEIKCFPRVDIKVAVDCAQGLQKAITFRSVISLIVVEAALSLPLIIR